MTLNLPAIGACALAFPLLALSGWAASTSTRPTPRETADVWIPALVRSLQNPDPKVRQSAAHGLGRLGPAARAAIPALCYATADPDADVRRLARESMRRVDPQLLP